MMEQVPIISSTGTTILTALSTLPQTQLSHLTHSISTFFHRHRLRLSTLLSSPTLFSLTLHNLHSLSLSQKSLLIALHLLSSLSLLTLSLHPTTPPPLSASANLRQLDSALLLLLLCEIRQHDPRSLETPLSKWRLVLSDYISNTILTISSIPTSDSSALIQYIEIISQCRRFVRVMGCGGGGNEVREVAASVAAVVALPSVEIRGVLVGRVCVICKEEMKEGRDVCEFPCDHLFHWICILPWLKNRNTCPCCRCQLPTDDVYGEIERIWEVVVKAGGCGSTNLGL